MVRRQFQQQGNARMSCRCGYVQQPDADWGYLDGPWDWYDCGGGRCDHVDNMRRCDCCSANWHRVGMVGDWDVDGAAKLDCPDCVAAGCALPAEVSDLAEVGAEVPPLEGLAPTVPASADSPVEGGFAMICLTFIVNGEEVLLEVQPDRPLRSLVQEALLKSDNLSRPLGDWELRHESGYLISEQSNAAGDYGFAQGTKLYLTLAVGFGASADSPTPRAIRELIRSHVLLAEVLR